MSARFEFRETVLSGLTVITRKKIGDQRGWLDRVFCLDELNEVIGNRSIIQINRTFTKNKGCVRGMHFQYPPSVEMKFVCCLKGKVFDVAVDLRSESSTFLKWHSELLSENNNKTLAIPVGFAHGFQTLTEECEMLYLHTAAYNSAAEGGLNPLDPDIGISWPLPLTELSERDANHPMVASGFKGVFK